MGSDSEPPISGAPSGKALSNGQGFAVPGTTSFVDELSTVAAYKTVPTQMYLCCIFLTTMTVFFYRSAPLWVYALHFFVWRIAYNFGIGYLLYVQSKDMTLVKAFKRRWDTPGWARLRRWFESGTQLTSADGKQIPYKMEDYPPDFNTWVLFRVFVNIILANDFITHCVLCFVAWEVPTVPTLSDFFLYAAGLALMAFAFWSKRDAHRVIGNFAWYWGDFFFLLEADLTFDGIFQMFPHPMYTVGYSFYYGLSLITKSYLVFYCSVIAHILQMVFLVFVESPHIEKIYGAIGDLKDADDDDKKFKGKMSWFTHKRDMIFFFNLNIFRASDVFTILVVVYSTLVALFVQEWYWHLLHFVLWRLFHTVVLGYILTRQSKDQFWVKNFASEQNAFDNWKKVFNLSLTMNHFLFAVLAWSCFAYMPENTIIKPGDASFYWCKVFCGIMLVALQVYVSNDVHTALGDFGWFYGDFFITSVPKQLTYSGIYRYMNNPESVMGFCGYYGIAMISSSYRVGTVALFCHAAQLLFTRFVETPHMQRKYETLRKSGGLEEAVEGGARQLRYGLLESAKERVREAHVVTLKVRSELRRRFDSPGRSRHSDSDS